MNGKPVEIQLKGFTDDGLAVFRTFMHNNWHYNPTTHEIYLEERNVSKEQAFLIPEFERLLEEAARTL